MLLKRRRMHLQAPLTLKHAQNLKRALSAVMGVRDVDLDADQCVLEVTYDPVQATAQQIEQELARVGARLGGGWAERLRRAFVHYLEETEVESLEVRPGSAGHGHRH